MDESLRGRTIKVEEELCFGCLSRDRSLAILGENSDIFMYLLGSDYVLDPSDISLCWECSAILRSTRRFQQRIQRAQDIMHFKIHEEKICLSTLTRRGLELHSSIDKAEDNAVPLKDRFEIKCENEYDSEIDIDENDYDTCDINESVLNKGDINISDINHGNIDRDLVNSGVINKIDVYERMCYKSDTVEGDLNKGDIDESDDEDIIRICVDNIDSKEENLLQQLNIEEHMNNRYKDESCDMGSRSVEPLHGEQKWDENKKNKIEETTNASNENIPKKRRRKNNKCLSVTSKFACDTCSFVTTVRNKLIKHLVNHENCVCEICDRSIMNHKNNLKRHLLLHAGKRFPCNYCNKSYNRADNLKSHLKLHTDSELSKKLLCDFCNRTFSRAYHLKTHLRIHTGEELIECKFCEKKFNTNGLLKKHIKRHMGDKRFSCELCNKAFIEASDLKKHMNTHTGEKPYECDVCGKRCAEKSKLKRHRKIHSHEKPYRCNICDMRFRFKKQLKNHQC